MKTKKKNKSKIVICINCKNHRPNYTDECAHNYAINPVDGTEIRDACFIKNKNGNCKFYEEKYKLFGFITL